ncbi:rhomboid-like protein [Mucilaginibacter gracilis]|uniref:Rhomboid-like protein n=1 Tax=Mucilaginibacter gracilis TaxID=423350 RepID=A0A495J8G7_9SPHI|nr:rhomboid family intramembrane serine protease [Mucilaginibacter gracilis]RKR85290.1 rhomboid-like protein [Mucilaginibacter gracilis]
MSNYRQSPLANLTPVVKNLLIINIIFYVATWLLGSHINMVRLFSAFYFDSELFKPWQIISYMFMHDPNNIMHIIGNMFALFIFGPALEQTMGSKRFFNFYFICGIGALFCNMAVQAIEIHNIVRTYTVVDWTVLEGSPAYQKMAEIYYTPILGASGAVFGILIAFAVLFPDVELMLIFFPIPIKAKYFVSGYVVFELISGLGQFKGDSVAHFAHIGGALFGFIMIKIWGLNRRDNFYH